MFLLNLVMAITGYIVWGTALFIAVLFVMSYFAHWVKYGERPSKTIDREVETVIGSRQLSLFDERADGWEKRP